MKKIRILSKGKWSKWYDFDKVQMREDIEAVETKETMTLLELKKYPDLYKKAEKQFQKRVCPNCGLTGIHGCISRPRPKQPRFRG